MTHVHCVDNPEAQPCALLPAGEPDAERLSGYIGVRRRPGRDARGRQQRSAADGGAGGPRVPEAGAGHPHGRMEILHLLGLSSLSSIIRHALDSLEHKQERKMGRRRQRCHLFFSLNNCQPRKPANTSTVSTIYNINVSLEFHIIQIHLSAVTQSG